MEKRQNLVREFAEFRKKKAEQQKAKRRKFMECK